MLATIQDVVFQTKTLLGNILRRITYVIIGIVVIYNVDGSFLKIGISELAVSIVIGIIIHNLNDFGFLTLVNKRNIFN